ncbi:hypothetical protein E3Q08_02925 [Wallemia mellicola]|nr:hypothetical protein E3Q08_02925 [Wallemia mellicola]
MKSLRRSLNKDKASNQSSPATSPKISVLQPPQLVIKALDSYKAQKSGELSFDAGVFYHVPDLGKGGDLYYEAHDPLKGTRGLVPRSLFEPLRKGGIGTRQSGVPSPVSPTGKSSTQYAVVQFDFIAERPDELSARAGEPIIVIAQSNHEWFVAKPIMRLGGPGLIPVAFVEIRDQKSNQALDTYTIVRSGIIPKVEDWKRQAADYKKASIPLGKFEFDQQPEDDKEKENHAPDGQPQQAEPVQQAQRTSNNSSNSNNSNISNNKTNSVQEPIKEEASILHSTYIARIVEANVVSHYHENEVTWFQLDVTLLDTKSKTSSLVLFRLYEDFYDFQIRLLDAFPVEAGRRTSGDGTATPRILPYLPGPIEPQDLNESSIFRRRLELNQYINELSQLPERILSCDLMNEFLDVRPGDRDVTNLQPEVVQPPGESLHSSTSSISINGGLVESMSYLSVNNELPTSNSVDSSMSGLPKVASESTLSTASNSMMKVKVLHQPTGDLIALRISPSEIKLQALIEKIKERIGSDVQHLWSNEDNVADRKEISTDEQLQEWVNSGVKLSLVAS